VTDDLFNHLGEFGSYSIDYWKLAIQHGFVRINGIKVSPDYKFHSNDELLHKTHRFLASFVFDVYLHNDKGMKQLLLGT